MKISFISPANIELNEAIEFYENQLIGLGSRFFLEIDAAIKLIRFMPEAWTKIGERTQTLYNKRFPLCTSLRYRTK